MCGIAGLKGEFTSEQLSLLESSLKHRGPDASGRYVTSDNDMALIHTRLSIQDISSAGNQPMVSSCKNFVLSYNGEIYNFKKLKAELVKKSYRFYGKSDSEVVLNLFIEYGISFLKMLEGDFAISIWDNKLSKLLIARDRMGVIRNISRDIFDVVVFYYFKPSDDLGGFIWNGDNKNIILPETNIFEKGVIELGRY